MPECPICHVPCFVSYVRAGAKFYECQECFHIWCEETHTSISKAELQRLKAIEQAAIEAEKELTRLTAYKGLLSPLSFEIRDKLRKALKRKEA
jgi:hypothetical protein